MWTSTPLVLALSALPRVCLAIPPPVEETIHRDVCILGGGSSGTYAAIRLSQDLGKSVVVIEKAGRLGGHTGERSTFPTRYLKDSIICFNF